jgi:hypothetical protein
MTTLIHADYGDAFMSLCSGARFFLMTPGVIGTDALGAALNYLDCYAPPMRGLAETTPAACYELRWTDYGDTPADVGRLCVHARPWLTVDELRGAVGGEDEIYIQMPINGEWVQRQVVCGSELKAV